MRPFWHPMSAILLSDRSGFATPTVLRLLLRGGSALPLVYAGDRMWPALAHGQEVVVDSLPDGAEPAPGSVALACPERVPDLLRVLSVRRDSVRLAGDSDPSEPIDSPLDAVLGVARAAPRASDRAARLLRRIALDLREALEGRPDPEADPARTVLSKYDAQAPYYSGLRSGPDMPERLLSWVHERVRAGGRILVAGSGAGHECFALAKSGYEVVGVDFSPAMVSAARREGARRAIPAVFHVADLRTHAEPAASLAGIFFTYDVYSFVPSAAEREDLLLRMSTWLEPTGVVFLSARRYERLYDPLVLTVQRAVRLGEERARWGQSHTRWIAPDGALRRSFVQVFGEKTLRRELAAAGFRAAGWRGNHLLLECEGGDR